MGKEGVDVGRDRAGQRCYAPIEGHLPERADVVADPDGRHRPAAFRAGDRRHTRPAGDDNEAGADVGGDPAGTVDDRLSDRVEPLRGDLWRRRVDRSRQPRSAVPFLERQPPIGKVLRFGRPRDPPHHLDDEPRVVADRGLAGEHAGIGAVEDGVGDVGRLGPRRPSRMLHAVEHLGGDDHRLLKALANADDPLLHHRHRGNVDLHPQIAAGDHDDVGSLDDRFHGVDRLALLDLGHDAGDRAARPEELLEKTDLDRRAHERQADEIGPHSGGPLGMLPIRGTHGGHRELHAGEVDPLTAAKRSPLDDTADDAIGAPLLHHQRHRAVGEHHRITRPELVDERGVGGREGVVGRFPTPADKSDPRSLDTFDPPPGKLPEADLRAGKVDEDAHGADQLVGHPPDAVEHLLVFSHRAVGHVEAEDVDAGLNQRADRLFRRRSRAERGDDLRTDQVRIGPRAAQRANIGRSAGIPGWIGRGGGHGALRRWGREGQGGGVSAEQPTAGAGWRESGRQEPPRRRRDRGAILPPQSITVAGAERSVPGDGPARTR